MASIDVQSDPDRRTSFVATLQVGIFACKGYICYKYDSCLRICRIGYRPETHTNSGIWPGMICTIQSRAWPAAGM